MKQAKAYTIPAIRLLSLAVLAVAGWPLLSGCDDTPDEQYYYTSKGEMAINSLPSRSDTFSKFIDIIHHSSMVNFDLLGTYGSYTVFAPTNEAVDLYLASRGLTSVEQL